MATTTLPTLTAAQELELEFAKQNAQNAYLATVQRANAAKSSAQATSGVDRADVQRQYKVDRSVLPSPFAQRGFLRSGVFHEAIGNLQAAEVLDLQRIAAQVAAATSSANAEQAIASNQLQTALQQVDLMREAMLADLAVQTHGV